MKETSPKSAVKEIDAVPLSTAQLGIWFAQKTDPSCNFYNSGQYIEIRGEIQPEAFQAAVCQVAGEAEALRVRFVETDNGPKQIIEPAPNCLIQLIDLSLELAPEEAANGWITADMAHPIDLASDPIAVFVLLKIRKDRFLWYQRYHHIVNDGFGRWLIAHRVADVYSAMVCGDTLSGEAFGSWRRLLEDETQYRDSEQLVLDRQYWLERLADRPELISLAAAETLAEPSCVCLRHTGYLTPSLVTRLLGLAKDAGTPWPQLIVAAAAVYVGRLTGAHELLLGVQVSARVGPIARRTPGMVTNTVPLRLQLDPHMSFGEVLQQVAREMRQALRHQRYRDEDLRRDLGLLTGDRRLFGALVNMMPFDYNLSFGGHDSEMHNVSDNPVEDLSITTYGETHSCGLRVDFRANPLLHRTDDLATHHQRFLRYLSGIAALEQKVEQIELLSKEERDRVLHEWNETKEFPCEQTLHELFEAQVERTPEIVAVVYGKRQVTYDELNRSANQLAHYLRKLGIKPDQPVGICAERSVEMVVALLAVLKAGGAYVPLDPSYPAERLRWMLQDSTPIVLLIQKHLRELLAGTSCNLTVLDIEIDASNWHNESEKNPDYRAIGLTPQNLAYIIYTSGSTGLPKGTMIVHRSVCNLVTWMQDSHPLDGDDSVLQKTPFSFDASVTEFFWPLLTGARLVMARPEGHKDPAYLSDSIHSNKITTVQFVPTMLRMLLEMGSKLQLSSLVCVQCGGEALPVALVKKFREVLPHAVLQNLYGPTEATVDATAWDCLPGGVPATIPIGRPIANTQLYVLDENQQPVAAGVVGELYIGGKGLARGYLNHPKLTAERFLPSPFGDEAGARIYKTGDRARWRSDGMLEFHGRNDFQVKIRGFRIELGEIEAALMQQPGVREALVTLREDKAGEMRLVAYYTSAACTSPQTDEQESPVLDTKQLQARLAAKLPDYMVPAACIRLEEMPLTANGKLDRRRLTAPEWDAYAKSEYQAPAGKMEETLAGIWTKLLHLSRVGRHDNFFELGGHSLLAVRLASLIRQTLGVEATISDVFAKPQLIDLALHLEGAAMVNLPRIQPVERNGALPLSFAQQRLWFLAQMEGGNAAYHISVGLRLKGDLHHAALRRALDRIIARHEALRTTFTFTNEQPVQRIRSAPESSFHLVERDLRNHIDSAAELARLVELEAGVVFNLETGPLIRGLLVRLAEDHHVLLLSMHHIVFDGWSMRVFRDELAVLYTAFHAGQDAPLPDLEIQYADYAVWQRQWIEGQTLQQQAAYWKTTLAGAPALLSLPTDHPRPSQQDFAGAFADLILDEQLTAELKELSRRHGTTLFMTLLASWAALMTRLSGQPDVVVGTPVAGRGRVEIEHLIGFFVNTLSLRLDLSGSPSVKELLAQAKTQTLSAQQHQDIPFEQVVELLQPIRSLSQSPIFQVMFAWQNSVPNSFELQGLQQQLLESSPLKIAKFDLTLSLGEAGNTIAGGIEYATSIFEPATIARYLGYFRRLLRGMVAGDAQIVERWPILSKAEYDQVIHHWNNTGSQFLINGCVHELFEEHADKAPDAVAVICEFHLSYRELNRRANQLAHYLQRLGVKPDERVAVVMERSFDMVVALLAVLKAGGAYVPVDPTYPAERLRFMIEDSAPVVLLTQSHLAPSIPDLGNSLPVLDLTHGSSAWQDLPAGNPDRKDIGLSPDHLAYVIYTSGSTGKPKGVMVEHRNLNNLIQWHKFAFALRPEQRSSSVAGFGFDAATWEIWPPLCAGAALILPPAADSCNPEALLTWWARQQLDVSFLPTPLAELAFTSGVDNLQIRTLLVGGDRLHQAPLKTWPFTLVNNYGPTESTVVATSGRIDPTDQIPSIGRPITNARIYILDTCGEPVPVGVAGELYVGGAGVGRGYLNRPDLTAEKFLSDPFVSKPEARMYQTGDLGRWRADGSIEFLGRNDFQVKLRGIRIELGEIETRLAEFPGVREGVVIAREDIPGDQRLVAYYTGFSQQDIPTAESLRSHMAASLPEYMVPGAYVRLVALPLTANGKVDRKVLPAPDAYLSCTFEAPKGAIEISMAQIWSELLHLDRVGRHDNFFELGGHSLLAVQMSARVRNIFQTEFPLRTLFENPTIAGTVRTMLDSAGHGRAVQNSSIETVPRGCPLPVSYAEEIILWLPGSGYNMIEVTRLKGDLDVQALKQAFDEVANRHEIFRTTYELQGTQGLRFIAPAALGELEVVEFEDDPADRDAVSRWLKEQVSLPFNMTRGPLFQAKLLRLEKNEYVLHICNHHIISDGWSRAVLNREILALYEAFSQKKPSPLPELPIQYADYAAWHRNRLQGEGLTELVSYWKTQLKGAPNLLDLPRDFPRGPVRSFQANVVHFTLSGETTKALRKLSQSHGATIIMTFLAAFKLLLYRYTDQPGIVLGTPAANRGRIELENLIGLFVNPIALHTDLSGNPTFIDLLHRVRDTALGAFAHEELPLVLLGRLSGLRKDPSYSPFFQVFFNMIPFSESEFLLAGCSGIEAEPVFVPQDGKTLTDLTLYAQLGKEHEIQCDLLYRADLFSESRMRELAGQYSTLLSQALQNPEWRVHQYSLVTPASHGLLPDLATNIDVEWRGDVQSRFAARASSVPARIAVSDPFASWTYSTLDKLSNQFAHLLVTKGIERRDTVAIHGHRSNMLVAAMLGVLRAGAAFVILDPKLSDSELQKHMEELRPAVLIGIHANEALPPALVAWSGNPLCRIGLFSSPADWLRLLESCSGESTGIRNDPEDPAYFVFVVGSQSIKKCALCTHRRLASTIDWWEKTFNINNEDRVGLLSDLSHDRLILETIVPLALGAAVCIPGAADIQPLYLTAWLQAQEITVVHTQAATWRNMQNDSRSLRLRYLFWWDDILLRADVQKITARTHGVTCVSLYGKRRIPQTYGYYIVPDGEASVREIVPLGKGCPGTQLAVLGKNGQLAGVGELGRIAFRTWGLNRVFFRDVIEADECYIANSISGVQDAWLVVTEDYGRFLPDGNVEFAGNADCLALVGGYVIQTIEIEAALMRHPAVLEAFVLSSHGADEMNLVAYVSCNGNHHCTEDEFRKFLQSQIASFMVPHSFVCISDFPRMQDGNVDRKAFANATHQSGFEPAKHSEMDRQGN